jgi:hypothetical protein
MWWKTPAGSEAGWGINFAHEGDVIFATWFTHDANGNAWYMSMTAFQTGPNTFSGTLYRTTGPPLDAIPFDPNQVQRIEVGNGTLTFSDGNNGTLTYTVNGTTQAKSITREVFGAVPACTWGGLSDLALATNYTDMWWAAGGVESGWGINFAHEGDVIFATWFTYDFTGAALPLSATLSKVGPGLYSGTLIRTSGPAVLSRAFQPRCGDAHPGGHSHGDVHQRQCRDVLLPGERRHEVHDADEVDRPAGVPPARNSVPLEGTRAQDVIAVLRGRLAEEMPGIRARLLATISVNTVEAARR